MHPCYGVILGLSFNVRRFFPRTKDSFRHRWSTFAIASYGIFDSVVTSNFAQSLGSCLIRLFWDLSFGVLVIGLFAWTPRGQSHDLRGRCVHSWPMLSNSYLTTTVVTLSVVVTITGPLPRMPRSLCEPNSPRSPAVARMNTRPVLCNHRGTWRTNRRPHSAETAQKSRSLHKRFLYDGSALVM